MRTGKPKIMDMPPEEIRIVLIRAKMRPAKIAENLKVTPQAVYRVINGLSVSDRIRQAVAEAAGIDITQIWPSYYLYGGGSLKREDRRNQGKNVLN